MLRSFPVVRVSDVIDRVSNHLQVNKSDNKSVSKISMIILLCYVTGVCRLKEHTVIPVQYNLCYVTGVCRFEGTYCNTCTV